MIIIIDGYNVLKQFFSGYIDFNLRRRFASEMQAYAQKKKHTITIVFDGDCPYNEVLENTKRVKIVYSGSNKTADDAIKDLIDTYALQDILLVTDDRLLNHYASTRKVVSIGSRDFYRFVQKTIAHNNNKGNQTNLIKVAHESNPELDALMQKTSHYIDIKEQDRPTAINIQKDKTKSKVDRLLLRKLEKL